MAADQSNGGDQLVPLLDADIENIVAQMRKQQLATDQMNVVQQALHGRSLTCRQGGAVLNVVKLGIMQRKLAMQVLSGRLNDLPDGLSELLAPLEGEIRNDMARIFGGGDTLGPGKLFNNQSTAHYGVGAPLPMLSSVDHGWQPAAGSDWRAPLERLRRDICDSAEVSDTIYDDVAALFVSLGLSSLPPREHRDNVRVDSQATSASIASAPSLRPSAVAVGFPSNEVSHHLSHESAEYQEQLRLYAEGGGVLDDGEGCEKSNASEESV